jgi:hypothetical protein
MSDTANPTQPKATETATSSGSQSHPAHNANAANPSPATPAKKGVPVWAWIAGGCAILLIISCIVSVVFLGWGVNEVGNEIEESVNEYENQQEQQAQEQENAFENPKAVGDTVELEGITWVVKKAEALGTTIKAPADSFLDDCTAASGSKFVRVQFTVKNTGTKSETLTAPKLVDADKAEFDSYSDIYTCVSTRDQKPELMTFETLNPGVENEYVAYYEIADSKTDLKLKVDNGALIDEDVDYVSLNL